VRKRKISIAIVQFSRTPRQTALCQQLQLETGDAEMMSIGWSRDDDDDRPFPRIASPRGTGDQIVPV
jgi:hypothetical protein